MTPKRTTTGYVVGERSESRLLAPYAGTNATPTHRPTSWPNQALATLSGTPKCPSYSPGGSRLLPSQ